MQRNVSIIISNYYSLESLQKVLWGYFTQTYRNFELIVVVPVKLQDAVLEGIAIIQKEAFFPIRILASDFQLPMKALMEEVATDFILLSEADCIPRQDFIAQHLQYREEGFWLQGTTDKISKATFGRIDQQSIFTGVAFENRWLKKQGGRLSPLNGPLYQWGWKAAFYITFSFTAPQLNIKNTSFWKSDLRYLELETSAELQRHLASLKKLKVKSLAYRTTVLTGAGVQFDI